MCGGAHLKASKNHGGAVPRFEKVSPKTPDGKNNKMRCSFEGVEINRLNPTLKKVQSVKFNLGGPQNP